MSDFKGREFPKGRGGFRESEKPKISPEDKEELTETTQEFTRIANWLKSEAGPLLREILTGTHKTATINAKRNLFKSFTEQKFSVSTNLVSENLESSFKEHLLKDKISLEEIIPQLAAEIFEASDIKSHHSPTNIKLNIPSWIEKLDKAQSSINSFLKNYSVEN
jgi:hypothetical protein